jgi:hypothetical protein
MSRSRRRTGFLWISGVVLVVLAVWMIHLEKSGSGGTRRGGPEVVTLTLPPPLHPAAVPGRPGSVTTGARPASLIEIPRLAPVPGAALPPRPPPARVHPLSPPPAGWYLQVAAYYSRASARRLVATLKRNGFRTWFSAIVTHERRLVRLWVGPYRNRRSAYAIIGRLTALVGNPPFWIHVRAPHAPP